MKPFAFWLIGLVFQVIVFRGEAIPQSTDSSAAPKFVSFRVTDVAQVSANFHVQIDTPVTTTGVWFEWGRTLSYSDSTPRFVYPVWRMQTIFDQPVCGFMPGTLYHVRAVAQNDYG